MRPQVPAPLSRQDLEHSTLNTLVRNHPELTAILWVGGVDPIRFGGLGLAEVVEDAEARAALIDRMMDAVEWRGRAVARGAVSPPARADQ